MLRIRLCGGVEVEAAGGRRLPDALFAGRQGRLAFAYLVCERDRSVPREELAELLWGDRLPASWTTSLSSVISKLRKLLAHAGLDGSAALPSAFGSYRLHVPDDVWVDFEVAVAAAEEAERSVRTGDQTAAIAKAAEAAAIAERGFLTDDCRWVDEQRDRLRDIRVRAALARAEGHLLEGAAPRAAEAAREAVALDELRESGYRVLMRALAAAGERAEALRVWERCRTMLVEELGVDPSPETEAVYLDILGAGGATTALPSGVVTFLLTDIVESSALWEREPAAMATALERHDRIVAEVIASNGGTLLKTKLEGDATVSVFTRASAGAVAALALADALASEDWPAGAAPHVRMALHTGEAFERDGDYFGPALNRAARLRALAADGQILLSQAVAELVHDHLPEGASLTNLGHRDLRGLSRGETVYELRIAVVDDIPTSTGSQRPPLPTVLAGSGPFVGRAGELERLAADWDHVVAGRARAVLVAGEPGVGKTRLAGEWSRHAYDLGALVLYGRCDEDLGVPYQPFAEAIRGLGRDLGELSPSTGGDPESERAGLFDAVVKLLTSVSADAPVVLVLDDLHWAAKPTLLLLRHVLRFAEHARIQIIGTYRNTDLDRTHPLAATLADLHRDGTTERLTLGGLDDDDVNAYVAASGHDDEDLSRALASVTAGNPFFLIEALRHVEESGGKWDASTLPQGVREAVGRRVSRLSDEANDALLAGAVVGSTFDLELVEKVLERDLVDAIDEACHAGIVVEEHGGRFRFNHAIVRRSLLAEVASVKRVRLHQKIADNLEFSHPGDEAFFADLAHHYFESAWAGNAGKAFTYCKAAGDQAMARLAYEEAADLYDRAVQALDIDGESAEEKGQLLLARCDALLAAGDAAGASTAVSQLESFAGKSERLSAWAAAFSAQLAVLTDPSRLTAIEGEVARAAETLAAEGDHSGEAKAHTVRAACLARMGRYADCEIALDHALTAARKAGDSAAVNAVLAGAPLAALWGPSPVPRAGGRCLDVIRLLRITTGSPAVEVTSICCQAVLEAFRGRAEAARRMLDKARGTLRDLGLRHDLLKLELFAGVVKLVADDAAAADAHLRRAHNGFARMGLDTDTAVAAALLARACVALDRLEDADALCQESERLAGHDLKASIAWRTVRAQLLAASGSHGEARRLAEEAVALAARTDALVDHGDALLALAAVLAAGRDHAAAREAASRAAALYERKGASTLVERARAASGAVGDVPEAPPATTARRDTLVLENLATRTMERYREALVARDWAAFRALMRDDFVRHNRHQGSMSPPAHDVDAEVANAKASMSMGVTDVDFRILAIRGDRLALTYQNWRGERRGVASLRITGVDAAGKIAFHAVFGPDDLDGAYTELDRLYIEGDEIEHPDTYRAIVAGVDAFNRRDSSYPVVEFVDRRLASAGTVGSREWLRAVVATAPDSVSRIAAVHRLSNSGVVATLVGTGTGPDGVAILDDGVWVTRVSNGYWRRAEIFAIEDVQRAVERFEQLERGDALARFDELERGDALVESRCATVAHSWATAVISGDAETARQLSAPQAQFHDGRRIVGRFAARNLDDVLTAWHGAATEVPSIATIVTRGSRLVLIEVSAPLPRDNELAFLGVLEIDSSDLITYAGMFSLDDSDGAFAELEARYLAGEAAPHADVWRLVLEINAAVRSGDLDSIPAARGYEFVDHREASFGTMTRDEHRALIEHSPASSVSLRYRAVHRLTRRGVVYTTTSSVTMPDGVEAERTFHEMLLVADGKLTRVERFPENDVTAAIARFDSLVAPPALENECLRVVGAYGAAVLADDAAGATSLLADDFVTESREAHPLFPPGRPRDEEVRAGNAWRDLGFARVEATPLATRGDRLALVHVRYVGELRDTHSLRVHEIDSSGAYAGQVVFDGDDLDDAVAELDTRYLAGEAAPFADTWSAITDRLDHFNRRVEPTSPDLVLVDHRKAGFGTILVKDLTDAAVDVDPDIWTYVAAVHRLTARGGVFSMASTGLAEVERGNAQPWLVLASDGKWLHAEMWEVGEVDAAVERFEALVNAPVLENACTRAWDRQHVAIARRDWDAIRAHLADDFVAENRTAHALVPRTLHRDEFVAVTRASLEVIGRPRTIEYLAIRGQRLALQRLAFAGRLGEAEILRVRELAEDGRFAFQLTFDGTDLDAALVELDRLYLEGEGAQYTDVWRPIMRLLDAYNRKDRRADVFTGDSVSVDNRAITGVEPRDAVTSLHAMWELAPDVRQTVMSIATINRHGAVATVRRFGSTTDGIEFENISQCMYLVRDDKASRVEFYDEAALDAALARFAELTDASRPPQNAATRLGQRIATAVKSRDWAGLEALFTPGWRIENRNLHALVQGRVSDGDASAWWQAHPGTYLEETPVATRGDRLALVRRLTRVAGEDDSGPRTEVLWIRRLDESGRCNLQVGYPRNDVDGALAELDARYIEGEAEPYADVWGTFLRAGRAHNERDESADVLADDFVLVDHHPMGFGEGDKEGLLQSIRETVELVPNAKRTVISVDALNEHGAVVDLARSGQTEDGVELDGGTRHVIIVRNGQLARMEIFPRADVDRALARFAELTERPEPPLDNLAVRTRARLVDAWLHAFERRTMDEVYALFAPDFRMEHRIHLLGPMWGDDTSGLDQAIEHGATDIDWHTVATRGDRLALFFWRIYGPTEEFAFENGRLVVSEVDGDGLLTRSVLFESDDFDGAFQQLDTWYCDGEAAPYADVARACLAVGDAFNRRANLRDLVTPDFETIDHRAASFGRGGVDQLADALRELLDLLPDFRIHVEQVHTLNSRGGVTTTRFCGTTAEGTLAEWTAVNVLLVRDGRLQRGETFAPDDLDAALARFEPLSGSGSL